MLRKSSIATFVAGLVLVAPLIACATVASPAGEDEVSTHPALPSRDGPCVSDMHGSCSARFPQELLGIWERDGANCTVPGNPDSDAQFEIQRDRLLGYEHWNRLLFIEQIVGQPRAWKVSSHLHIDEQTYDHHEIYVLHGPQQDRLTVVDESRSVTYALCR